MDIRSVGTVRFKEASSRYGDGIPALLLIDGWQIKCLLVLLGLGVLGSLCVTTLTTAISKSINMGLTAGSYAFGMIAIGIGALTLFSAIL